MPEATGVLVLGDSIGGELSPTSRELLAVGRKAADDLGEELAVSLLGRHSWTSPHNRPSPSERTKSTPLLIRCSPITT